jgi:hypothetical protein
MTRAEKKVERVEEANAQRAKEKAKMGDLPRRASHFYTTHGSSGSVGAVNQGTARDDRELVGGAPCPQSRVCMTLGESTQPKAIR